LLVAIFVGLFIRLGVWQLSRLGERRSANTELAAQLAESSFLLNAFDNFEQFPEMSDRQVTARGQFDFDEQVVVRNRNDAILGPGVHLVAPFVLDGTNQAVMVDRGWISSAEHNAGELGQYSVTSAEISGVIQQSENAARNAVITDVAQSELFRLHIPQLQAQSQYELLPIYVLQTSDGTDLEMRPFQASHQVDLSEGSHLSYVVQWFSFAIIFVVGYVAYIGRNG
ncbi:MAG: SURF1 family protein, partial [Candidatus Promineifilaceae bacterium]